MSQATDTVETDSEMFDVEEEDEQQTLEDIEERLIELLEGYEQFGGVEVKADSNAPHVQARWNGATIYRSVFDKLTAEFSGEARLSTAATVQGTELFQRINIYPNE